MNDFDTALVATASAFSEVFGEEITYKPRVGDARTIEAIVDRNPPGPLGDMPHGTAPSMTIDVENDSDSGIASDEVDCGGDQVTVAVRIGKTPQDRPIKTIISQDAGRVVYGVR